MIDIVNIFIISLFVAWYTTLYLLSSGPNTIEQKIVPFDRKVAPS